MAVSPRFRVPVLLAAVAAAFAAGSLGLSRSAAVAADSVPAPPAVGVASYVIVDYDTGQILAESDPHRMLYPASTLKVLTADTLIPRLNAALDVTPQAADFAAEPDGSVVGMKAGVTYSVADLWRATFLESANDAVAELAHLSGGLDETVSLMRKTALALGAHDTTVVDADGYDQDGQLTSAYDLALFARAGLRLPAFRTYCALKQATFPGPNGAALTLTSHDPMVLNYPGMIGIKGGLTTKAGHTYVGAATRGGHTIIETLMLGGTDVFDQAARLMDWGFEADGKVTPVAMLGGGAVPPAVAPTVPGTPTVPRAQQGSQSPTSGSALTQRPSRTPSPSPLTRVDAASRPPTSPSPWPGAAWLGLVAALAAFVIPVGVHLAHRRPKS